jgi:hypothetical protein
MAKQPVQTTEASTLEKRKAELARLNADIAALTQAADCVEQVSIWAWDAWCAADELSKRESNDKLYARFEKLSNQSEALKGEIEALLKSYKDALPTLTRLIESHKEKQQEVKAEPQEGGQSTAKKRRPTKAALIEEAKATLAAKENKANKVVKAKAKGRR